MAKRVATSELNHENWDQEPDDDDNEAPGEFRAADKAVLARRQIKTARRRAGAQTSDGSAGGSGLFSGFKGFAAAGGQPATPFSSQLAGDKPLSTSTPVGSGVAGSAPPAAEGGAAAAAGAGATATKFQFGGSATKTVVVSQPQPQSQSQQQQQPTLSHAPLSSADNRPKGPAGFRVAVAKLNEQVLKWVNDQWAASEDGALDFTQVFKEYTAYFQKLKDKFQPNAKRQKLQEDSPKPPDQNASTKSSTAVAQKDERKSEPAAKKTDPPKYDFDSTVTKSGEHKKADVNFGAPTMGAQPFLFGQSAQKQTDAGSKPADDAQPTAKPTTITSLFGVSATSTSAGAGASSASGGATTDSRGPGAAIFSFGTGADSKPKLDFVPPRAAAGGGAVVSKPGFFSFPTSATGPAAAAPAGGNNNNGVDEADEVYVPPKADSFSHDEPDALHQVRCKLFYMNKEKKYQEKGVGILYLKPVDGDAAKTQLLIRADNTLGTVLLNIRLSTSVRFHKSGKNNVQLTCVPNPPLNPDEKEDEEKNKIATLLVRVKTEELCDELLKLMAEKAS